MSYRSWVMTASLACCVSVVAIQTTMNGMQPGGTPAQRPGEDRMANTFSATAAKAGMKVFLIQYHARSDDPAVAGAMAEHRTFLRDLAGRKMMLIAGGVRSEGIELAIIRAKDEDAARQTLSDDPFVSRAKVKYDVLPFAVYADASSMLSSGAAPAPTNTNQKPPKPPTKPPAKP